jgi:hypothetical protein
MFKRTVECLFVLALRAGLLAGGAGATMYYYNIPDVRNLPKAECEKALKAKKYFTEIIWVEVEAEVYTQIGKHERTLRNHRVRTKNFPIKEDRYENLFP